MILFKTVKDIKIFLGKRDKGTSKMAFVPTMGALHGGHISLINNAKNDNFFTVCSIFVNPTQFNNQLDFSKYPATIENDIYLLEKSGCDVLFLPSAEEIYPNGPATSVKYDLGYLETILEGKYRPGHFQGVCQVVQRLLEIVQPKMLYLGQKDYQQCMVISKLIDIMGVDIQLNICPTQREITGLAMSSRNIRLTDTERTQALRIYETLELIKRECKPGNLLALKAIATENLSTNGFVVDYVEIADAKTLELKENWDGASPLVALIAAYLNEVRLIDNLVITN
ncbi:pantoate--beta-alanine ligase [Ferruginibacter lapsinanis]|uniref:pantoate--beta-alanine ligase n=1 Tax=Ferruginibacter lapsinanis TaxID=563172 RepID=UPI001E437DBE|nr:pantoate--beta-alanine ligase [Ferruginibacter lapsinanis]UEG49258.1 pantoate--beta-alanine ligase [Ferruginibacter lapsinanis]